MVKINEIKLFCGHTGINSKNIRDFSSSEILMVRYVNVSIFIINLMKYGGKTFLSSTSCLQRASLEVTPFVNIVEEKNVWTPYFIKLIINVPT